MDEVLFRSSQKLENLQLQLSLAASHSKDIFQQYSQQGKSVVLQAWHGPYSTNIKTNIKEFWQYILSLGAAAQEKLFQHLDPQKLYYNLAKVFWDKWTSRDVCFMCAGFVCGSIVGMMFALSIKRKESVIRYMQAIQCTNYLGIESALVVENARAPDRCADNDVIITVKAASVHPIDAQICSGYGRTFRQILQKLYNKRSTKNGLPVTLGRDCTGVVVDVGSNVKRLEIGDEIWLTVPFWYEGTLSQSVIVPEFRIGRKPKNVGFEGACSLPYAGILAMDALKEIQITQENAQDKKFLILGGCTPVGCILVQILTHWKANVTTTCSKRAVPVAKALGASEVIVSPESATNSDTTPLSESSQESVNAFQKELELEDKFDHVIITRDCALTMKTLEGLCEGKIVSTVPQKLSSDSCGFFSGLIVGIYIRFKFVLEKILGIPFNDFDEAHMCYVTLDELADLVESGCLQTVVDKVFHPEDIEIALNHIQSSESIGSTVITFR